MARRLYRILCLLCACVLLSGCGAQNPSAAPNVTLPPVESKHIAPENDVNQTYIQTALLYLPSVDGTRLLSVPETLTLSASHSNAEALCRALLVHPGTELAAPLGEGVALSLASTDAVEVSGGVATVSLSASALRLSHEALFTVGQALANTLCQFGDISYVNVLIAGVQPGLDIAATLPAGCFQSNTREDLSTLWARASAPKTAARRAISAALYYPATAGKGILCEARTLSFAEISPAAMAQTLLEALSSGAEYLPGLPKYPDLVGLLSEEPVLEETGGMRRLALHFDEALNAQLLEAGITRSVMVASLTYTLTTFLPGLDGISISIGSERLTALTPSATYTGAGETIYFADGLIRRRDFVSFLLDECTLYFATREGMLQKVSRAIPFYEARNARALVNQLILGPQSIDSVSALSPALPQALRDADLLGVALDGDTLVLNFSSQLPMLCEGMDETQERLLIYSLVNTLTELSPVKKVSIYIMGEQPETLAGALFLPGDFWPNLNILHSANP
ncbi:MAG: hypothetical protein E7329_00510 [Clostridiales bacterium]|nr:hypothetical protein [Clostridiales bacterium]